jgi:hypothetical protein
MSNITDAQNQALQGGVLTSAQQAAQNYSVTETVVSGTPFQVSTVRDADLYINITTAASFTLSMGPEAAGTSIALNAAESDALGMVTVHVPRGFYVKITGTVADFTVTAVLR